MANASVENARDATRGAPSPWNALAITAREPPARSSRDHRSEWLKEADMVTVNGAKQRSQVGISVLVLPYRHNRIGAQRQPPRESGFTDRSMTDDITARYIPRAPKLGRSRSEWIKYSTNCPFGFSVEDSEHCSSGLLSLPKSQPIRTSLLDPIQCHSQPHPLLCLVQRTMHEGPSNTTTSVYWIRWHGISYLELFVLTKQLHPTP